MSRSSFILIVLSVWATSSALIGPSFKNVTTSTTATGAPSFIATPLRVYRGISDYCKKSQLTPLWYLPTPIECCSHDGECEMFIEPNESRYGLTNPDPKWRRRHCLCDRRLYKCVTRNLTGTLLARAEYGFRQEMCIIPNLKVFNGQPKYEFVNFMTIMEPR